MRARLVILVAAASAILLVDRCYAQASGPQPSCCSNDRDLATQAAKQHPGQEWGYLSLQQLGEEFEALSNGWSGTIKVPTSGRTTIFARYVVTSIVAEAKTEPTFSR